VRPFLDQGYTHVEIKIGAMPLAQDLKRIEAVLRLLPSEDHLAVDAMHAYDSRESMGAASALVRYGLWWIEDFGDRFRGPGCASCGILWQHRSKE